MPGPDADGSAAAQAGQAAAATCQVCGQRDSKYCCPRCDKKTCSLECVKEHKAAAGCSGKRDRAAFVGRGQLDEAALLSDYRFLEQVKLAEDVAKRAKPPAPRDQLPAHLGSLVHQAGRRGVRLHLLAPGMERRRGNTTRYDARRQEIAWRVEWAFWGAPGARAVDARVAESAALAPLLAAHLTPPPGAALKSPELQRFADAGAGRLAVLLRREREPANAPRHFRIDPGRPLGESLRGKVVVEFPVLTVVLPEDLGRFTLVEEGEGERGAAGDERRADDEAGAAADPAS